MSNTTETKRNSKIFKNTFTFNSREKQIDIRITFNMFMAQQEFLVKDIQVDNKCVR